MSACAEFAEHVWKPGSCKNCFHPRSAHGQSGPLLEDEDGLSSPSPYSKPTIAVRPTMMNTDTSTDINMNTEQASQMSSVGLKKAVDLPPLFMDSNGCHRTLLIQNSSISGIKEYSNVSTAGYSKECMIISNMFMSEEDSGGRQNQTLHSTFMNSVSHRHLSTGETDVSLRQEERQMSAVNRLNRTSQESSPDSCLSDGSSLDSFTSPQNSPDSASAPPDRLKETEPIYAESTKRKCRPAEDVKSRPEVCENQRATITVMAAHTEENNLTFYLSSPDSAVSTQWTHFSPKEASVPAFTWPDTLSPAPSSQSKPQSSPPVPPKIHTRSPRLGTSSLTPLPELSFHVSPNDITGIPPPADSQSEHKSLSLRSLDGRIDEEDEEHEREEGTSDAINECAVWKSRPRESSEDRTTPGTNNSIQTQKLRVVSSSSLLELNTGLEPPPPPPKKHHRVCNRLSVGMDLERIIQQGSVENLSQSLQTLHFCTTNTSTDSLHTLTDTDSTLRSCPSPLSSSPLASAPASPQPDVFPSNSLVHQLQPPPLPQKKLVNRTVSAPSQSGVKPLVRARPRLPFGGSDINVSRPDADGRPSSPTCSSGESVERRPPLRSRTLDEPQFKGQGRLGGHSRGSITSSSSPQLNILLSPSPSVTSSSTLQLQTLLNNMDSREGIYSKLGGLYAESLRRLALKCEVHFTSTQRNPLRFNESNWSLFKLTCNKPSCVSGDAVYYSASCASDVRNTYAVKICKGQTSDSKQCHLYGLSVQQNVPPHFNLQQDCGHFIACVPQSMLPSEENLSGSPRPVEQERVVVITQDVPHQSAADFVREWESFHRAQPEVYERRVCFLLLQLCTGLEHIKSHGVTHRDLCLENLLLVQHRRSDGGLPDPQQQCLPRLLISNFAKAKRRSSDDSTVSADPRLKRDHARLAPEIVSAAQYRKFDEFQTGILIYELLHQRNPFELTPALRQQEYRCKDLPSIPNVSIYSGGLQRLAHLLLEPDPGRRIHIQDAKRVLQGLLWGPRRDLLEQPWVYGGGVERPGHEGLLNWLDVKRALLMMKFAERSLEPERNAELEDWLCCQYFSAANPKSLCQTAELLYNLKFTH